MSSIRICALLSLICILGAAEALRAESILLTVDAIQTSRKLLHARLVIPVKPGALTLLHPKWIPGDHAPDEPIAT